MELLPNVLIIITRKNVLSLAFYCTNKQKTLQSQFTSHGQLLQSTASQANKSNFMNFARKLMISSSNFLKFSEEA